MIKTFDQWVSEKKQGYSKGGPLYEVAKEAYSAGVKEAHQITLRKSLEQSVKIAQDPYENRGWYICGCGGANSSWYLHNDGIVRFGVADSFWPTHDEALAFYTEWKRQVVNMEEKAKIVETLDNLIAATNLPMKPEHHFAALKASLPAVRDRLKKAYLSAGGEDYWRE